MRMAGHWMSEGLKAYPPRCGDCGGGPGESLGCFPQTVSRQVERDGQVLVVLYCGFQPLLTVFGKLLVGQEWYGERDVGLGWAEVAVLEGLVDDVERSAAARLFQVGCHSSDGVDLQVSMLAAA